MRWVQASPDEPAGDGRGGNGWIFTLPLCVSPFLSPCSSHLSSHLSVVPCLDIFSLSALCSALLSPQQGTVQIKPDKGLLSTNMWWSTTAALTLRR